MTWWWARLGWIGTRITRLAGRETAPRLALGRKTRLTSETRWSAEAGLLTETGLLTEAGLAARWRTEAWLAPETRLAARPRLSWRTESRLARATGTPTAFAREVEDDSGVVIRPALVI